MWVETRAILAADRTLPSTSGQASFCGFRFPQDSQFVLAGRCQRFRVIAQRVAHLMAETRHAERISKHCGGRLGCNAPHNRNRTDTAEAESHFRAKAVSQP